MDHIHNLKCVEDALRAAAEIMCRILLDAEKEMDINCLQLIEDYHEMANDLPEIVIQHMFSSNRQN